jgi:hypothetical protein
MNKSGHAVAALEERGFRLAKKPKVDIPDLPRDITDLHDDDLMDLFVQFTGWTDHLSSQLAIAAIDEREADRSVSAAESQAMLANWKGGTGDRIAVVKAQISIDPVVQELTKDLDEKYAYRKLLETLYQNVERDSAVVSRELTRRTSDGGFNARKRKFTT